MKISPLLPAVLLLLVICPIPSRAEDGNAAAYAPETTWPETKREEWRIEDKEYWKGYFRDTKRILPGKWGKTEWLTAGAVLLATGGLYLYDEDIRDWAQENRNDATDEVAHYAKPVGDPKYSIPPLALIYLYGHLADSVKARRTALLSLESAALTGLFTQTLKLSFHRHRPSTGAPYDTFDGPSLSTDNLSFPSGHASYAWSVMTVLALAYEDTIVIPALAYGAASLAALSRVHDNAHWASDAFFGSAMGYFTARALAAKHSPDSTALTIVPVSDGKGACLILTRSF